MIRNSTMSKNDFRPQIYPFPQGKIQDEFLGCRRRERLQPTRTTPTDKQAFLGTLCASKECLARIRKW